MQMKSQDADTDKKVAWKGDQVQQFTDDDQLTLRTVLQRQTDILKRKWTK